MVLLIKENKALGDIITTITENIFNDLIYYYYFFGFGLVLGYTIELDLLWPHNPQRNKIIDSELDSKFPKVLRNFTS